MPAKKTKKKPVRRTAQKAAVIKPPTKSEIFATIADKTDLGAGFRYSAYGPAYDPGPDYWVRVGEEMAGHFAGAAQ